MFVVAGVTGKTGAVVARALLAAKKKVRVLVRDARKAAAWTDAGAEVRVVPTLDAEAALASALEGADGAYLLSPPDLQTETFLADRRKTVDAIAGAVEKSKVPHVVFLSSIGAQMPSGTGPILSVRYAEERLAETSAKLTFVRAATFLENWAAVAGATKAGKLPTFVPRAMTYPMVATQDIGAVAAKALLEGPSVTSAKIDVIELAGTRDLSANDVAEIFGKLLGRDVAVEEAPLDAVVPMFTSLGLSKNIGNLYRDMYEGVANGTVRWEKANARFVRGTTDPATVLEALL
jgi:uncharacterized protein YbjT (DUF2867 family)